MTDYYGRSPADVPAGLTAPEWAFLCRFNATRLRQDVLEVALGPEPIKAGALAALWSLGCPPGIVLALAMALLLAYAALCRYDQGRLRETKRIAAKMSRALHEGAGARGAARPAALDELVAGG